MGLGDKRIRALYGILHKSVRMHRYTRWRWIVGIAATIGVGLLAWTKTMRFDLWGGQHYYLGERVTLVQAARGFAFPFLAINIAIILTSRISGRYLCGFVCPVGSLSRLGEWARFTERKAAHRFVAPLVIFLASLAMTAITFSFWVSWRVFSSGTPLAMGLSASVLIAGTLGLFLLISRAGLGFCHDWCPSGAYFAVLGQDTVNGIAFDKEACTDCGVCTTVCPMDLDPKHMSGGARRGAAGVYADYLSNFALCVRCGDCVVGCEEVGTRGQTTSALTMGWLGPDQRESRVTEPQPQTAEGEDAGVSS